MAHERMIPPKLATPYRANSWVSDGVHHGWCGHLGHYAEIVVGGIVVETYLTNAQGNRK